MAAIPLDVYGLILDSLAEDDEELTSMRACSLVSRAFLPLARKHIFASVEINSPFATDPPPSIDAFVNLIERNPEIAEYVRKIDYCIASHDHIMSPIPRTLGKLTKLKSLTIWHHSTGKLKWMTQMRPAFLQLMRLPTLSYLKLRSIENFPASDLIHSSSLEHLQIEHIDFAEEDIVPPTTPLPRKLVHLREYTVGFKSTSATKKLLGAKRPDGLPIVDLTELTKVTATCDKQEDIDVIQPVFMRAEHLEEIDLTISESLTYAGLAEIVIRSIRTLKTLKLRAVIDDDSEDPLSGLCNELEKISATGRSIIETLSINVDVSTDADCKRGDEWGLLDKVLTKKDAWLALKEVSLKIEVYDYGRDESDDILDALDKLRDTQFKALSTGETIIFSFGVTQELI